MKKLCDGAPHYPWEETPVGQGFFIPSLTPYETQARALVDVLRYPVKYKSHVGLRNRMLGVLFERTR